MIWQLLHNNVQLLDTTEDAKRSKKRRIQRACDNCRRKKIRCDAAQALASGSNCSNCASAGSKCTFFNETTKRGPSKSYVSELEQKLENMEELLRRHASELGLTPPTFGPSPKQSKLSHSPDPGSTATIHLSLPAQSHFIACCTPDEETEFDNSLSESDYDDDLLPSNISQALLKFNIEVHESRRLFHGKSSGLWLVQEATQLKREQGIQPARDREASDFKYAHEVSYAIQWEQRLMATPIPNIFTFPPEDLIRILFDLFFRHFTTFLPVIHRPTFEAQYNAGLHLKDRSFGRSVLLACAIASRYCDDPRVFLKGIGRQSAGWIFFTQARDLQRLAHVPATLHDIQCYVMLSYFLQTTYAHNSAWAVLGNGIRAAQDTGMHRRRPSKGIISLHDEQQKRAFWCLIFMDRQLSALLGRPLACQDEDFDLDLPVEVDDEYWGLPDPEGYMTSTPRQPTGMPSNMSCFVASLKLSDIMALTLRTIYSTNKSRALLGLGGEKWNQFIVSELDSRMNKWVDAIPEHLKWDPNLQNDEHFVQSAILYAAYHTWQIFIHRPFIHSSKEPSALSFPSMSICTNAARSCSHVLEALQVRGKRAPAGVLAGAINSGIVLLMALWSSNKTGSSVDAQGVMRDVNQCISFLKDCQLDWQCAKLLVDILEDLANCGDLDLGEASTTTKRSYDEIQDRP
ncbi:hypothetical protein DL93DRAFT_2056908, partial [Clavulina sp. PMI_390]